MGRAVLVVLVKCIEGGQIPGTLRLMGKFSRRQKAIASQCRHLFFQFVLFLRRGEPYIRTVF